MRPPGMVGRFVEATERRLPGKTRTPAILLPFVLILGLLAGFWMVIRTPVRNEVHQVQEQIKNKDFKNNLRQWYPLGLPIGAEIADNYTQIESQALGMMPQLGKGVRAAARDFINLFIIPILSFFLLKDGPWIRDSLVELWFEPGPSCERRRAVEGVLKDAHVLILQYMRALLFLCLATLIAFTVALSMMRVPYATLLALIAFPLEFVPLVGPMTSAIVIVGVSKFYHYPHVAGLVAFLLVYRLFQDYVLSPHLMNKSVKLHPVLVMFGVFAGGELGGVGGIFLSVPILAVGRLVYYELSKRLALWRDPPKPALCPRCKEIYAEEA